MTHGMFPQIFPLSRGRAGLLQWVRPLSEKAAQVEAGEANEAQREDRGVARNRGRVVDEAISMDFTMEF